MAFTIRFRSNYQIDKEKLADQDSYRLESRKQNCLMDESKPCIPAGLTDYFSQAI